MFVIFAVASICFERAIASFVFFTKYISKTFKAVFDKSSNESPVSAAVFLSCKKD